MEDKYRYKSHSLLLGFIQYSNIEVAAGAIISCLLFAQILNVKQPLSVYSILGLTVWQIYTFDRLVDVKKQPEAESRRHQFHLNYFYPLVAILITSFVLSAVILFWVPLITIKWGGALLLITLSYFVSIHFLPLKMVYHKEIIVALVYVLGTALGPLSLSEGPFPHAFFGACLSIYCLALLNLLIFSYNDRAFDDKSNFPSIVNRVGAARMQSIILLIGLVYFAFLAIAYLRQLFPPDYVMLYSLMGGTLIVLHYRWNPRYRLMGDLVFLFPGILLI